MNEDRELEQQLNGLGQRLNDHIVEEAGFKGRADQRIEALEYRQNDQRLDIKELYTAVDKVRLAVTSLTGRIIGAAAVLALLIPLITEILQNYVFKK